MAGLDPVVRERTDALDSLGNTTAATGKGFAIGSAALTALALVSCLRGLRDRVGVSFRFGLANITRRAGASVLQVTAFGVGIMMLLLLTIVRGDLLDEWRRNLPTDAPNFFLINIRGIEKLMASNLSQAINLGIYGKSK